MDQPNGERPDPLSALRDALKGDAAARALHRLHCVVLVASGRGFEEVAALFGDDARSIRRWVRSFESEGVEGLADASRSGRPQALSRGVIGPILAQSPRAAGHDADDWSGSLLQAEIARRFGLSISARQCQRLLAAFAASGGSVDSARSG